MQTVFSKRSLILAVGCVIGVCAAAQAVSITVPNGSFEDGPQSTSAVVPHWMFQSDGASGTLLRNADSYPGNPGGPDNGLVGFINGVSNATGSQIGQAFTDSSVTTIAENTTYTVTVALGNVSNTYNSPGDTATNDYDEGGEYRIELFNNIARDDGTPGGNGTTYQVAARNVSGATVTEGSLVDYSVSFTTGAAGVDANVGLPLYIQIQTLATRGGSQSTFDDVRLDAVAVPEPMTAGLLGLGGLVLGRRRRA